MMENRKYQKLSEREHVLQRPGMYIGSTITETSNQYVLEGNKFIQKEMRWNGGFIKIFDEILMNSIDESKRQGTLLNTIKVDVDKYEGTISVHDNGGMPVKLMEGTKEYIPVVCFSNLRAGSNFDDTEQRTGVGTNGLGSVCTNIFSTLFEIETADGKNKLSTYWQDNMSTRSVVKVSKTIQHYTRVTYTPDLKRFGMDCIDNDTVKLIEKRVYEVAGCNPNLNVYFNGKKIQINSFKDYCNMYLPEGGLLIYDENKDWQIGVSVSPTGGFTHVSYVNTVYTYDGGTHCEHILNQIIPYLREKINKKYKTDILPSQIKNHLFLFVNSTVYNPMFDSQSKTKLISDQKNFGTEIKLTEKFLKQIYNSEVTNSITDWLDQKKNADEKKAERILNSSLSKIKVNKYIDCKWSGTNKKNLCRLVLTEGDSAMCAFRKFRNPDTDCGMPLKGKSLNVRDLPKSKVMENEEIKAVMSIMGLKFGEDPIRFTSSGKVIEDNTRIGEIHIYTDADVDGSCCAALIVNYLQKYWPSLFKALKVARVETPILIAKNKKTKKETWFYYDKEYKEWCEKNDLKNYDIQYLKGLGSLNDSQSKEIYQNPHLYYYELDENSEQSLIDWFGKDSTPRKERLI